MKKIILSLITFSLLGGCTTSFSEVQSKPTVNILTWWGYLDHPWVASYIENRCNTNISYDKYYDNQNFISRYRKNKNLYDVIIFESPTYKTIKNSVPSLGTSKLYKHSENYNSTVRQHYLSQKYPKNIAYFFESVTGILWNKENISVSNKQSISDLLKHTKKHLVVLIDDPIYFDMLIQRNTNVKLSYQTFSKIFGKNTVIITNSFYHNIYSSPLFSLAYQWSGEAINNYENLSKKTQKKLYFSISPHYSFISSDLIAQLNNRPATACVANVLASKAFLNRLQKDTYYFSPYTNTNNIHKPFFKKLYKSYIKLLPKLEWVKAYPDQSRKQLDQEWDLIKLKTTIKLQKEEK